MFFVLLSNGYAVFLLVLFATALLDYFRTPLQFLLKHTINHIVFCVERKDLETDLCYFLFALVFSGALHLCDTSTLNLLMRFISTCTYYTVCYFLYIHIDVHFLQCSCAFCATV